MERKLCQGQLVGQESGVRGATVWTLDSGEMENKVTASNDDGHEHNTYGTAQGKLSNVNSRVLLFL